MKKILVSVVWCLILSLSTFSHALAGEIPNQNIPQSVGILKLKKIPVTAALLLPPTDNQIYFKQGYTSGLTLGDKFETYIQQAFSQVFDELYLIRSVAKDETAAVIIKCNMESPRYTWKYADQGFSSDRSVIQTVNVTLQMEIATPSGQVLWRDKISSGDMQKYVHIQSSMLEIMFNSIQEEMRKQTVKMDAGLNELAPGALITAVKNAAEKVSVSQELHQYAATIPAKTSPGALTKADLTAIVQTAIEQSGKGAKKDGGKTEALRNSELSSFNIAEEDKIMGENDIAVVIGIEGYQNLPKSEYSYDDAKLVKEYFKALGIKERNIEFLGDEKATKSAIEKSLEGWLFNKVKQNSRVFIYYSGHGAPEPATGESFLVPYDGDPNYLSITGYPLRRLYGKLGLLPSSEVVIILDACFSGAGGRSVLAKGARPLVMNAKISTIPSNIAVFSATQGMQISTSSTERGHGIFTYYLLRAIKDGKKNIADVYTSIKPLVEDEAKAINVQQSPSLSPDPGKLRGRFLLRK
jgi:hypothetical protein